MDGYAQRGDAGGDWSWLLLSSAISLCSQLDAFLQQALCCFSAIVTVVCLFGFHAKGGV
jgi:hypothetical protein